MKRSSAGNPDGSLHPRNPHRGRYDFGKLVAACPELGEFVRQNPLGEPTIDFADPDAVRALNRALLADLYGVARWEFPAGFLCPPVPGRADAIHHLADLLSGGNPARIPRGRSVRVLDIGVGASCIYPLIGHRAYGWSFVGSEIDAEALASARRILRANPGIAGAVEVRRQPSPGAIFRGVLHPAERFNLSICNPPFHASLAEARRGSRRKWANLGRASRSDRAEPVRNFGGRAAELCCPGGEEGFVGRMIGESAEFAASCLWFSTLVSREEHLAGELRMLQRAGAADVRVRELEAGQKKSRILAWTFIPAKEHGGFVSHE